MKDKKNCSKSLHALEEARKAFEGFAKETELENVDDIVEMVKEVRKEKSLK